jgi:hypothetical protein
MPAVRKLIRIVVASPSDVQAERKSLDKVIEELNCGVADLLGLRLKLSKNAISCPLLDCIGAKLVSSPGSVQRSFTRDFDAGNCYPYRC